MRPQKALASALLLAGACLALEAAAFIGIVRRPPLPEPGGKFDLVAVFRDEPAPTEMAIQLCRMHVAKFLVVSGVGPEQMDRCFDAYGRPGEATTILPEPHARSTGESARLVARLARQRGFHRILLVTTWDRQPRSYLLLRLALVGAKVDVRLLSSDPTPYHYYLTPPLGLEMIKFWGSLSRWGKSALKKDG